jgi:2-polyprenyl-3-methyl-5-hydroxy-6-metoxy-1,4-benzoquinol methylase
LEDKKKQWEETQLKWDDKDFLKYKANALMKKRWVRLNKKICRIIADEVVEQNGYITMLDIGAGRGEFFGEVKDIVKRYVGIEPSEAMLEFDINEEEYQLKRGTGEEITYKDEFDAVLIKEVLDHCYEPQTVIKNAYTALNTGGSLIVTLTNKNSYYKALFKKKAKQLEEEHKDHLFNFSPDETAELFKNAGFQSVKIINTNYLRLPYGLEDALGKMPQGFVFGLLNLTDAVGSLLLNKKGGSFIVTGKK